MNHLPFGARLVRCLARAVSFLYPARFRQQHGREFSDVALHPWRRPRPCPPDGRAASIPL